MVITIALALCSTTALTAALGFVFWAVAARITTTEVVGRASAVVSAMQLIATFGTLGLHTLLIAELPRRGGAAVKRLVVTSLGMAGGVAFVAAAGYAVVYHFGAKSAEWMYATPGGVALFGFGTAVTAITIVLDGALVGAQQSGRQVSRNLVFSLGKLLALPLAAIVIGLSPQVVFLVWLLGNLVSLLILAVRTKELPQWATTMPSPRGFSPLWRTAAGHHWVNVATQAPRLAMPIVVATQLGNHANAGFYAALLLVGFLWIVPNHLATAMFALHSGDPQHFGRGLNTALQLSAVVSILAAAGTPVLARPLLAIFGSGYEQARYCLIALAACTFASAVKSIYIAVRRAQGALGKAARAAALGAGFELAAAETGLKVAGVTGIGIALGAAMVLQAVLLWPVILNARRRAEPVGAGNGHRDKRDAVMRILVDHSGYALLNIGDIAMLQACVHRLRTLWPDAVVHVVTESPLRLAQHCPGTHAVASTIVGHRAASLLPRSYQLAAEQMWKTAIPLLIRSKRYLPAPPMNAARLRLLEAAREADLVVSSGGGFLNDVFWWHGAGVLSVLAMAQRLGKPTAMFGQGIGPLTHPLLAGLVKATMPRLVTIGLREGVESVPVLKAHGVAYEHVRVTGDDALLLATPIARPPTGTAIGLNVRMASYSGIDASVARRVVALTREAARRRGVTIVALPVSRYQADSDLQTIRTGGTDPGDDAAGDELADIETPAELAQRAKLCRIIVTGSYHAAVFGLAAGIPAICITNSAYYDGKFHGLAAQFPGGCQVLRPGPQLDLELSDAIDRAWADSEATRDDIHAAAVAQVALADQLYQRFKRLATQSQTEPINISTTDGAPNSAPLVATTGQSTWGKQ